MGISSDIRKSMSGTNTHLIEPQGTIKIFHKISVILLVFLVFVGCSQRRELAEQQAPFHFPPYTRHLKDFKICLDPGHGGQGHVPNYKRGPTGVREAEVNLRVALYLRELLQEIGANVIMTRVDDSYVSLAMRSQIANESGADFFISLHHNGIDNPKTNYTSTWYHGDADDSRQSLDLARYIQLGVSDALELPTSPAAGLYSDKLITASGFGVLRMTECPAVLCEASFLSNPEEEARLQEDDYLRKEAYGYFLGIARYVEGGFPRGVLVEPQHASVIQTKTPLLQIQVKDGLHERGAWMLKRQQIFTDSIRVKIDGVSVPYHYDRDTDLITVAIENPLSNGKHFVETELVNYYGNHSLPSPQWFKVAPPAVMLDLDAWVDTLPADGKSYVGISVTARDAEGMPIADGEPIHAETSNGTLAATRQLSKGGTSYFYLYAPEIPGTATVKASYGETSGSLTIHFSDIDHAIVQGQVSDANSGRPLENVQLHVPPHLTTSTDAEGHFFIMTGSDLENLGEKVLHISKSGYYPDKREIYIKTNRSMVVRSELHPIADGAFASTVIVLDSQSDTPTTEKLIETLEELLKLAGAKVYNIHSPGRRISVEERIKTVNAIADSGYYLQINHGQWTKGQPALVAAHYRGNQGTETFLKEILKQFNNTLFETPIVTVQDRTTPEIQQTNKMAMTLEIRSLNHPNASAVQEAYAIFFGAWTLLKGDGEIDAEKQKRFMAYRKEKQAYSPY
ncbi:MAG: N-acetylmuramoyl-L-alanine amidase [Candidatus Poribacteria bacterium]|nr:N-acetylmuramoyl-L-alanine amidase [Candidatus Poribacteria bacterium]